MKNSFSPSVKTTIVLFLAPLLIFTGCQRQIHITNNAFADVDSIPRGFARHNSFTILPVKLNEPCDNKLFAKEIARKAATIIEDKGYLIEYDDSADYCVQIRVASTQESYTVNVPKYIPGETEYTEGSVEGKKETVNYQEKKQSSGTMVYVQEEHTCYRKVLDIEVYKARHHRNTKEKDPVWQGSAMTCDENDDLRETIDYLLITAFNHFGKNTLKKVTTTIGSNDKEVERLRMNYFNA